MIFLQIVGSYLGYLEVEDPLSVVEVVISCQSLQNSEEVRKWNEKYRMRFLSKLIS